MTTALHARISAHPTTAFFVLAFATSWSLMAPAMLFGLDSPAALPFFVGVFGPATAAAVVTRTTRGSVRGWLRSIMLWRLPLRWYAVAIGLPFVLAIVASAEFLVSARISTSGSSASVSPRSCRCSSSACS
jgi:CAAX protease family protein